MKNETKIDKCFTTFDGNTTIWSNYQRDAKPYNNNMHCIFNLKIPPNAEVYVTAVYSFEPGVDYIVYYDEENNMHSLPSHGIFKSTFTTQFIAFAKNPSLGSNISFEFFSDGSVQGGYFSLNFTIFG